MHKLTDRLDFGGKVYIELFYKALVQFEKIRVFPSK
jgi:hypothetical protein